MTSEVHSIETLLSQRRARWLITGVAGFIGSNLLETLLLSGQTVVGLDSFFSGKRENLDQVSSRVGAKAWKNFTFIEGDIRDAATCCRACKGTELVLHQAALGSVPRSMEDPQLCHDINVSGFLNILMAAQNSGVQRVVYASSSAVYGDDPGLPKQEENTGQPLSPYAASKWMDEIYASVFARSFDFTAVGLRYFNVYGPRQDPKGAYAAVIPNWIAALLTRAPVNVNGDGETSRDFCYVLDVVQGNLQAALSPRDDLGGAVFNLANGRRTTLNELFEALKQEVSVRDTSLGDVQPVYRDFRPGDVRHSLADITLAKERLGFEPQFPLTAGLRASFDWYCESLARQT